MSDTAETGIPCGECAIGVYTERAFLNKTARLFSVKSEQERMACMPRCKTFDRPCQGALEYHGWLIEIDRPCQP